MKRLTIVLVLMTLCHILLAANVIWVLNSQSRTLSRIEPDANHVNNSFSQLGNVPNKVLVTPDYLYVVNSGDNSLQKISKTSGNTVANHFVAVSSNPWDAIIDEDYIYVSGLFSAKVYKLDSSSGQVLAAVPVGIAPEAMAVANGKLYVTNAGNYAQNYAGSSVSVIDLASFNVIKTITTGLNPQYIRLFDGLLHVSCTGNWTDAPGEIYVIDSETDEVAHIVPIGGSPGNIWINGQGLAYVADGSGYSLYSYDANTFSALNPASDPLPYAVSDLAGTAGMIALVDPNWGSNAQVSVLNPDLSPRSTFTVGMMPSDIKMDVEPVSVSDQIAPVPQTLIKVYPSPLRASAELKLKSLARNAGEFRLYNIKGERIHSSHLYPGEEKTLSFDLPAGTYIYSYGSAGIRNTGKLVVLP